MIGVHEMQGSRGVGRRGTAPQGLTGGAVPGSRVAMVPMLLAVLVLGQPADGHAQGGVRLLPQLGIATPLSDLGEVRNGGMSLFEAGRKSSTLALGLGLELGNFHDGTSLRGQIGYATQSDLPVGGFECQVCAARATLLTATVAAVFRPLPQIILVQPHFVVGAGVKRYDFDPRDMEGESWTAVLRDQTRVTGQLGAGMSLSLLGFRPAIELGAFLSRFEPGEASAGSESSEFQTDLFLMVTLPLGG